MIDLSRFRIDLGEGRVFWVSPPKNHPRLIGAEAGCPIPNQNGKLYWTIRINRKAVKRGHLIFFAVHGRMPFPLLDHENGNSLDDRPSNLREATVLENAWNHKGRSKAADLPMGVRSLPSGRFQARIGHCGRQLHLGSYGTIEEAHSVYLGKRKELFREFA